jgi:hypothetical protein
MPAINLSLNSFAHPFVGYFCHDPPCPRTDHPVLIAFIRIHSYSFAIHRDLFPIHRDTLLSVYIVAWTLMWSPKLDYPLVTPLSLLAIAFRSSKVED